jgi:hypothetical protein
MTQEKGLKYENDKKIQWDFLRLMACQVGHVNQRFPDGLRLDHQGPNWGQTERWGSKAAGQGANRKGVLRRDMNDRKYGAS